MLVGNIASEQRSSLLFLQVCRSIVKTPLNSHWHIIMYYVVHKYLGGLVATNISMSLVKYYYNGMLN